jgi:hypothetical protein
MAMSVFLRNQVTQQLLAAISVIIIGGRPIRLPSHYLDRCYLF